MVIVMRVVPYESSHIDELRAVCIEQASERARTEEAYGQFTLWMYCDPYLENGIAYMLLDVVFSTKAAANAKELLLLVFLFPCFHICYGTGSIIGLFKLFQREFRD